MIDINLIKTKKRKSAKKFAFFGIDIRAVNIKAVLITIIGCYIVDYFFSMLLEKRIKGIQEDSVVLEKTLNKLKKELVVNIDFKKELDEFNKKFQELQQRETEVNGLLSARSNPYKILENMAREMPEDLWFKKLQITSKNSIRFDGVAVSYKSIGDFITKINETPYFNNSLKLHDSKTFTQQNGSKVIRLEQFGISGSIKNFDLLGD